MQVNGFAPQEIRYFVAFEMRYLSSSVIVKSEIRKILNEWHIGAHNDLPIRPCMRPCDLFNILRIPDSTIAYEDL